MSSRLTPAEVVRLAPARPHRQPESYIRKAICDYLCIRRWLVFPVVQGPLSYPGISDLIAVKAGRTVFVEVKTSTGRLSAAQEAFRQAITDAGGEYIVARSIEDVMGLERRK